MRRWPGVMIAVAMATFPGALTAHEGHVHSPRKLMGTVTAVEVERNRVTLKTPDGKTQEFYVDHATKYHTGQPTAASLADLQVGTRVVVTGKTEAEKMVATEVKIGVTAPHAKAAATKPGSQR